MSIAGGPVSWNWNRQNKEIPWYSHKFVVISKYQQLRR